MQCNNAAGHCLLRQTLGTCLHIMQQSRVNFTLMTTSTGCGQSSDPVRCCKHGCHRSMLDTGRPATTQDLHTVPYMYLSHACMQMHNGKSHGCLPASLHVPPQLTLQSRHAAPHWSWTEHPGPGPCCVQPLVHAPVCQACML